MSRGQDLLMVVLQRVGLIFKTSLGLKKGFLNKSLPKFPKARDDRVFNPKPKKGRIVVHQPRKLLKGVARGIMVIDLKQLVLIIPQRIITFMLSALEVIKRLLPMW